MFPDVVECEFAQKERHRRQIKEFPSCVFIANPDSDHISQHCELVIDITKKTALVCLAMKNEHYEMESRYESSPTLHDQDDEDTLIQHRTRRPFSAKFDSYQGLTEQPQHIRRVSSVDGSETATDDSSVSGVQQTGIVSEYERLQIETFFRGLKTHVYVCSSLANLYSSTTSQEKWDLDHTGIPVIILDSGEARSRTKRRIQILLAERGTCFTLWRDTIDNLTAYRIAAPAFHTMHLSSDHTSLIGLSFDSLDASKEIFDHIEKLTGNPENISLSMAGKNRGKKKLQPKAKPVPLPSKDNISQPCCFQHITSIETGDRMRYRSMQTLVGMTGEKIASPRSAASLSRM